MAATIKWTVALQVPSGPQQATSGSFPVDAYDKLDVTIDAGAADKKCELQPGGQGQVALLAILTDQPGATLSYKVNKTTATPIILDQAMQIYLGTGQVTLLDPAAGPNAFFFTNGGANPAAIQIFVGRKAT